MTVETYIQPVTKIFKRELTIQTILILYKILYCRVNLPKEVIKQIL